MARSKRLAIILIACSALALVPFPTTLAPDFTLRVVDGNGIPLKGIRVWETCTHYTYDLSSEDTCAHYSDNRQQTDADGNVHFSRKFVWFGFLARIVRSSINHLRLIAHGSVGRHVTLFMTDNSGFTSLVIDVNPENPPNEIVLERDGN